MKLCIAMMILCAGFVVTGNAQTSGPQTMRARIPFTFTVGDKKLPAGVYTVSILNPSSDRKALQIRSETGRFSAIVQTVGLDAALIENSKLVFRRYGDRYFFANAQMAGDTMSLAAIKTRAERATQRAIRQGGDGSVVAVFGK
jgi:hypothetical protein